MADSEPAWQLKYIAPPLRLPLSGLLFDMDGTIIDSTAAVVKHWHAVGNEIGVPPEAILETAHGRRSIDTLKILAPDKANWEYVREMEGRLPKLYGKDAVEVPGARRLLESLVQAGVPWAIVTSGTVPLVSGWLETLDLPRPDHLITAESVQDGKPDPGCYLMGLERLGQEGKASDVLVVEDSPAGIRAGKAAGCKVLGLLTSHTMDQVVKAMPDWVVTNLESVRLVESKDGVVTLEVSNGMVVESC